MTSPSTFFPTAADLYSVLLTSGLPGDVDINTPAVNFLSWNFADEFIEQMAEEYGRNLAHHTIERQKDGSYCVKYVEVYDKKGRRVK